MKISAVICEYNPFHTGHLYQLTQAKKTQDAVICILSGVFVQRAAPAIAPPHVRAAWALQHGADMVVELPLPYAAADAGLFCRGGVSIAGRLPNVSTLLMGVEDDDGALLSALARIRAEETPAFKTRLQAALSGGTGYPAALTEATALTAAARGVDPDAARRFLRAPNNLLAVGYLCEIFRQGLPIEPLAIGRQGGGHHDKTPHGDFLSASGLRALLYRGELAAASRYLPAGAAACDGRLPDLKLFDALCLAALRSLEPADAAALYSAGEGIENRLLNAAARAPTLAEALEAAKTKRYPTARLKRLALEALLCVKKDLCPTLAPPYIRLLGIREAFKPYLKDCGGILLKENKDFDRAKDDPHTAALLRLNERASRLYGQLAGIPGDLFYGQRVVVV